MVEKHPSLGNSSQWIEGEMDLQDQKFSDLKEKPLGSLISIMFWNDPQRQIRGHVDNMEHTLLIGDYGTGW